MRRCRADNFISVARAHYATFTGHIFSFNRCGTSNLVKVSLSVAWSQQDILRNEQPKNWHEKKEKETQWKWNEKKNGFSAATSFHDCQFSVFVFLFWRSRFYHWRRWQAEMNLSLYIHFTSFFLCFGYLPTEPIPFPYVYISHVACNVSFTRARVFVWAVGRPQTRIRQQKWMPKCDFSIFEAKK